MQRAAPLPAQMIALLNHEPDVEKSIRLPCSLVLRDTTPPML